MMVWRMFTLGFIAAFLLACGPVEGVDRTVATIQISIEVPEENAISILQNPLSLNSYIGNEGETSPLTYIVTATGTTPRKIVGQIEGILPEGVQLFLKLDAPVRGQSAGFVELGAQEVELLSGIWGIYGVQGNGVVLLKAGNEAARNLGQIRIRLSVRET
jgi:hypothetical protein